MLQGIPSLMTSRGIASTASSLLTGLTAYYALADVTDSTGGTSLTNNGSVTFNANGANFVSASNQWLSQTEFSLPATGNFSFCFWMKSTSGNNFQQLVDYGGRAVSPSVFVELSSGSFGGFVTDASSHQLNIGDGSANYGDGNLHFYVVTVDRTANYLVVVDNVTKTNSSATALTAAMNSSNGLGLGADAVGANLYDGSLKGVGIWTRSLSGTETTTLWNSGTPLLYPF